MIISVAISSGAIGDGDMKFKVSSSSNLWESIGAHFSKSFCVIDKSDSKACGRVHWSPNEV